MGFDLVEYAPDRDPGYVKGLIANRLLRECPTGIAMRKHGLTDPHYLSRRRTEVVAEPDQSTGHAEALARPLDESEEG